MKPTKKCTKCGEEKTPSNFGINKDGKSGLRAYCKQCRSEIAKENRINNNKLIFKFMTNNKGQLPTDYSRIFQHKQEAIDWYEKDGKECEEKFNRKLYFTEIKRQKQA